jgi:prenylcysteine alpha-carboxyl methylesterase
LDIYLPADTKSGKPKPVIVFLCGGGWIIGYKAWSLLQGFAAMQNGVIFVSIDYRNFPQGRIDDMLEDLDTAMQFVFNHIEDYGGDISNVHLMGQSAGAHLVTFGALRQVQREQQALPTKWKATWLRGILGVSGPYNLVAASQQFHLRGLRHSIQAAIFGGLDRLTSFSPTMLAPLLAASSLQEELPSLSPHLFSNSPQLSEDGGLEGIYTPPSQHRALASILTPPLSPRCCPIILMHGTKDRSISYESSIEFGKALHAAGFSVTVKLFPGKSHTDLILEDPLMGIDPLWESVCQIVTGKNPSCVALGGHLAYLPGSLMSLARFTNPF